MHDMVSGASLRTEAEAEDAVVGKESVKVHLSRNLRVDFLVSIIFDRA